LSSQNSKAFTDLKLLKFQISQSLLLLGIKERAESYQVRVGSVARHKGGVLFDVVAIYIHPSLKSLDYDFAILHLAKDSNFPNNVEFIKLPEENDTISDNENTFVSGWGDTRSLFENPEYLKAVQVPTISIEKCRSYYGNESLTVTDQMICAGFPEGGKDSCQGD
jgi:trypsin